MKSELSMDVKTGKQKLNKHYAWRYTPILPVNTYGLRQEDLKIKAKLVSIVRYMPR